MQYLFTRSTDNEMRDNLTYAVVNENENGKSIGAHGSKLKIPWLAENNI